MIDALVFTSLGIVIGMSIQWLYRECRRHIARYRLVKVGGAEMVKVTASGNVREGQWVAIGQDGHAKPIYSGYEPIRLSLDDRYEASQYRIVKR